MFVQRPDTGIAKQHAPAPVRLQAMLVGINNNRVGLADLVVCGAGFLRQISGEGKVAAVRRIDVQAEAVLGAQTKNLRQGIDGARSGGSQRGHDAADVSLCQPFRQSLVSIRPRGSQGNSTNGNPSTLLMRWWV